uniref:Uncharacterized protein n=1 Tax=Amphimedon queenslandica TaxID=400682 RepID=A0A1X7VQR1_AMPQE
GIFWFCSFFALFFILYFLTISITSLDFIYILCLIFIFFNV